MDLYATQDVILFPKRPAVRGLKLFHRLFGQLRPVAEFDGILSWPIEYFLFQDHEYSYLVIVGQQTTVVASRSMAEIRQRLHEEIEAVHPTAKKTVEDEWST